jgi:hypothetical protein
MGTNYAPLLSNFFYAPMILSLCKNLSKTKKVERLKPLISLPEENMYISMQTVMVL